MINSFKINTTKKGDTMATCRFEDLTGSMDLLVFPRIFIWQPPAGKPPVQLVPFCEKHLSSVLLSDRAPFPWVAASGYCGSITVKRQYIFISVMKNG